MVQQAATERNYHIFYQLVNYVNAVGEANAELKAQLGLGVAQDYTYLASGGCFAIEGVDDVEEFKQTLKAMKQLQFDEVQVGVIFKIIAAVLHLGNVRFEKESEEQCRLAESSRGSLNKAAQLLALEARELEKALTSRTIDVRGSTIVTFLNEAKARESLDSLAKFLYGELFDWLVTRINETLAGAPTGGAAMQFIGVLDIFGFEIFQNNSFEQLCINFTNEKMQQMFNSSIFKEEEAIYRAEGINHESVKFVDNQVVLDLIEKKPTGLLPMMDEEIRMPQSTDKTYLDKISATHKEHTNFSRPVKIANAFTVQHYAGAVTYNVEGFLGKNRDQMFDDLVRVIQQSKIPLIQKIVTAKELASLAATSATGTLGKKSAASRSLASQFVAQLKELNDSIAATTSHYIRCIKPNTQFKACSALFDTPMSLRQLRYAGVFEAVSIRKNGFPYRLSYEDFVKRFYLISKEPLGTIHGITRDEARQKVELIASAMTDLRERLHFGKTLVFYKAEELKRLEDYRTSAMKGKVILVQKLWRGARARIQFAKLAAIRDALLAAIASRNEQELEAAISKSNEVDFEMRDAAAARVLLTRVKHENKLLVRIKLSFPSPSTLGELNSEQLENANEYLETASEMEPPFESAEIVAIQEMLVRSEQLKEARLQAEREAREREEAARRFAQSEAEREAEEARLAEIAAAEEQQRLAEESKKKLAEQFHLDIWEGSQESNANAQNALNVLFNKASSSPRYPSMRRGRAGTIVELDEESLAIARGDLPKIPDPLPLVSQETMPSTAEAPQVVIAPEDAAKYDRVKNRLWEAMSAPPYSICEGIMFQADGTVHVSMSASTQLKQAIMAAQQVGAFGADHPDLELRKAAYTAQMLMGIRMDCGTENWEGVRNRLEGAAGSSTGFLEVPEISAARVLASKTEISDNLERATEARDEPEMKKWVAKAKESGMNVENEEKILQALTDLIDFCEISVLAKDYVKIQTCIHAIEQLGVPSYLASYLAKCQAAVEARKPVLLDLIRRTLREMPDKIEMVNLNTQAQVLGIKTTDTDKLEEILALSEEKLCRLQLDAARALGNEERVLRLSIELKGHLLERFARKLSYGDSPSLKTPAEFASGKVFGKERVMEGLLTWTSTPIHAALTRDLDRKTEDQATKLFRNVMGWMGDRHYSYQATLLQEICTKVVNVSALRDELFAQVIKQLTGNPSADSMRRGWQLLLVLLMLVPPSPKFENYVGTWLLHHGQSYHIHELHETIFKGALEEPPTLGELIYIIYHLPPTPGESYASAKTITLEQAQKSGVDLSKPMETPALDRFDKHATLRGHGDSIKKERKRISDMRPPKRK